MPDQHIASLLNRAGRVTGKGLTWDQSRICSLRCWYQIPVYRLGERKERGELTLDEAAECLDISPTTMRRLIKSGELPANQLCKGAPWIIKKSDVEKDPVQKAATMSRQKRSASCDPNQISIQL